MKNCAIIDVGSNTIRLSVCTIDGDVIKNVFNKKITAGLAGYVKDGVLSRDGIEVACASLRELKSVTDHIGIAEVSVFATASLRNISNTDEAQNAIRDRTGFTIDLLSGEDEAIMGYYGVRTQIKTASGILYDIGGGSTEITSFSRDGARIGRSFPLGSLNLFKKCVRGAVLPDKKDKKRMLEMINETFDDQIDFFNRADDIYAVGGSARATLLIGTVIFGMPREARTLTLEQLHDVRDTLLAGDQRAIDLILKHAPDRVHTIIPGMMILYALSKRMGGKRVTVCSSGVREGYLWDRHIRKEGA